MYIAEKLLLQRGKSLFKFPAFLLAVTQAEIDWQLGEPITARGVDVLGVAAGASFFLTFPSISVGRHYHHPF